MVKQMLYEVSVGRDPARREAAGVLRKDLLAEDLGPEVLADKLDDVQVAGDARAVPGVPLHQLPPDPEPCSRHTDGRSPSASVPHYIHNHSERSTV